MKINNYTAIRFHNIKFVMFTVYVNKKTQI